MPAPQLRSTRNRVLASAAALVATVALLAPPPADAAGRSIQNSGSRIEKACNRIPNVRERVQAKIGLLEAGASKKGSIAWLNAKADNAAAKGKSAIAEALRAKAAVRQAALAALKIKLSALDTAAAACAARFASA